VRGDSTATDPSAPDRVVPDSARGDSARREPALRDPARAPVGDSAPVIGVRLRVAEARTRSARLGVGWGTLECGRTQLRLTDRGFLGPGRRVEFTARASRLGLGDPAGFAPAICPQYLRDDVFSQRLNYFAGITVSNQSFFGLPVAPLFNVYSERRGEPYAFLRETSLGVSLVLSRALGERNVVTSGASYETGRTQTSAVIGCVRFGLCDLLDLLLVAPGNTTRALDLGWVHDRTGGRVDPRDGVRVRADLRAARTSFALLQELDADRSAWNLYRPALDLTGFTRAGGGVLAAPLNWTRVFSPTAPEVDGTPFLPPQERIFSGGQNSVRGYQQNLLGPIVYTVDRAGVDSVPVGDSYGFVVRDDASIVSASPEGGIGAVTASLEWRRRFPWPTEALQWAVFADAGAVWLDTRSLPRAGDVRVTPGVGIRLDTPIGPFRVDVGYNPRQREAGKAFVVDSTGSLVGNSLFRVLCVSVDEPVPVDAEGAQVVCPRTFTPRTGRTLLSRLVFHFSLGQAF
jgi:outer membrane protein insertion porin family/translocation and assembly module TamA